MTKQTQNLPKRKRLLLYTLLSIVILAAVWISYFLINFDLNNYRKETEEKLSSVLSLPVTLGAISYNLHEAHLALQIDGLQIGNNDSTIQIDTRSIVINLKWRGLLSRSFEFAKVNLVQPHIQIRTASNDLKLTEATLKSPTPLFIDQSLLHQTRIDFLKITDGTVQVESYNNDRYDQQFNINGLNAEIANFHLDESFLIDMQGQLKVYQQAEKSPWQIRGEGAFHINDKQGLAPFFDVVITAENLQLEKFRAVFAKQLPQDVIMGTSDLELHLRGTPNKSIDFQINLSSEKISLKPSQLYTSPITLKNLMASGRLTRKANQNSINELSLQLDESHLAGRIDWNSTPQPVVATFTLLNSDLKVPQIIQWMPKHLDSLQKVNKHIQKQGSIQVEKAQFTLYEEANGPREWKIDRFKGEFINIGLSAEQLPSTEIRSLPVEFIDSKWQIHNGKIQVGSQQISLAGTGTHDSDGIVFTTVDFSGEIQPDTFLEEWKIPSNTFETKGSIGVKGHLEGQQEKINLDLQTNLSHFTVVHQSGLEFAPEQEDKLALHGTITPEKVSLDHGSLKWSKLKGHIAGSYLRKDPDSLILEALMSVNDLTSVTEALPLLKKLQLHGQADLSINQRGLPKNNPPEMILTLREAGLKATRFIADLSHINGRVKLTETGLEADNLRVQLGQSPLVVQAKITDFSNPRLLLDTKAKTIHANDLIFYSEKAMLRDIEGHLEIDRDGLTFSPVDVRLDGGTTASVRGTISFHPPYDVLLDITSDYANIGEVINLWTDHSEKPARLTANEEQASQTTVTINALAKSGDLYGMNFHDASGVITPSSERLTIHPLHFSVGEGSCNAQVIADFPTNDHPTMLRISGHAEDVDALEVYSELLNQKSILRGKLRGDFFINGETGSNYLPSSYGNFSLQIKDGVLHEFPILSKIFSLLNVSQIFVLELPDMDSEGMPFDRLTANFKLDKGILSSDDLTVSSEAMNQSYLGELNLIDKEADFSVAIHPLGTVDKIVSRIPIAGWLLTGEDRAFLTAHFSVKGTIGDVSVEAMPLDTLSEPTIGLLRRTLELPFKLADDPQILWGGDGTKKQGAE